MDAKIAGIVAEYQKLSEESKKKIMELVNGLAGMAMMGGAYGIYNGIKAKMNQINVKENISKLNASLDADASFKNKDEIEKAKARLYEIARVAPHVTLNHELVKSLIKKRLHTGLSLEDKQLLAIMQNQFHQGNLNSFIPQMPMAKVGSILADVAIIKEAAVPSGFKNTAKYLGVLSAIPVLSALTTGAINQGLSTLKQRKLKENLEESFSKAIGMSDPDREPLLQNKEKARQAFSTLTHFAPHVALDPQAARAFMNKIVSYDQGVDAGTVKELSEITKNLSHGSSEHPFVSGFALGSTITKMPDIIGGGLGTVSRHLAEDAVSPHPQMSFFGE